MNLSLNVKPGGKKHWGRGIEKICEACKKNGISKPEYTLHPEDIMVKFMAGKKPKIPKHHTDALEEALEMKLLEAIRNNPKIRQQELLFCGDRLNLILTYI